MKADLADLNAFLTVAQACGFRNAARGRIERLDAQRSGTAVRCRRSAPLRRPPRTAPWLSPSGTGQERGTRVARTYPASPDGSLTRSSCRMSLSSVRSRITRHSRRFSFSGLHPASPIRLQPAIPLALPVVYLGAHYDPSASLGGRAALTRHDLNLTQLPDDLIWLALPDRHRSSLP